MKQPKDWLVNATLRCLNFVSHYEQTQQIILVFVPLIKWLPQQWKVDDVNYAGNHEH